MLFHQDFLNSFFDLVIILFHVTLPVFQLLMLGYPGSVWLMIIKVLLAGLDDVMVTWHAAAIL
jgi:hypothetical protein